jgi:predicted HicB family RNase H-like nuclease
MVDEPNKHFIRIEHELYLKIEQAAKADGRSVANYVSKLLNDILDDTVFPTK